MSNHLTAAQSRLLLHAYKEHKGRWKDIMADETVQALRLERHQVESHIRYKKKQRAAGRESSESSEEPAASDDSRSMKREASEEPQHEAVPKKPKLTRQLSEDSLQIAEMMKLETASPQPPFTEEEEEEEEDQLLSSKRREKRRRQQQKERRIREEATVQTSVLRLVEQMMEQLQRDSQRDDALALSVAAHEQALADLQSRIAAMHRELEALRALQANVDSVKSEHQ